MASRDVPYRRLEEVKLKALEGGSVSCYLLHQSSEMCFSDLSDVLAAKDISYTGEFPADFAPNHSLFASKDRSAIEIMAKAGQRYFSDPSKSRSLMLETYAELGHPECCLSQVKYDSDNGLSYSARLGMQLVDLVRKYHVSSRRSEKPKTASSQINAGLKSMMQSKDDWTAQETRPVEEGPDNNDEEWAREAEMNDESFKSGEPLLRRAFLNVRLAREMPMCRPDCEKIFDDYTSRLVSAAESLGHPIGSLADGSVDFLEDSVGSYWNGRKAKGISELEKVAASGLLTEMEGASDVHLDAVREAIMVARGYEARILGAI